MNAGTFSQLSYLLKSRPVIWGHAAFIGLVLAAADMAAPAFLPLELPTDPTSFEQVDHLLTDISSLASDPGRLAGWGFTTALFFIGIWLLTALNQAGLIDAAAAGLAGRPSSLRGGWRFGWRKIWPILVVDTAVFLPLFLLLVLIIGSAVGLLLSTIYLGEPGSLASRFNWGAAAAGACLFGLLLVTPVVGLVTALVRAVALRLVLVFHHSGREALSQVRPLLVSHTGALLATGFFSLVIATAFFYGQRQVDALTTLVWPAAGGRPVISVVFAIILGTARAAIVSVLWTVAIIGLQSSPGEN